MSGPERDLELQRRYLERMGITVWLRRDRTGGDDSGLPIETVEAPPGPAGTSARDVEPPAGGLGIENGIPQPGADAGNDGIAAMDWDALASAVAVCTRCPLCEGRTQTVFGVGDRQADLLIIGEAPGAEEDRRGEPFVGRAGRLLDQMLHALGLDRQHRVFIANILKCRPPRNRDPEAEEVAACTPYLERQIALLRPRVILAVGRIAAQHLLRTDRPLKALRQVDWNYPGSELPVIVSYHPAYLLRNPADKGKAWQDLKRLQPLLEAERT